MKPYAFPITLLALSLLLAGCLTVFVPVDTPTALPTILLPTNPPPPVESVVPAATALQSAPLCTADPLASACTSPKVEERDKFCVKKVPYVLIVMPPGTRYDPADSGLFCSDEGIRNGEQMISCTGQHLTTYDLKVCNTTCSAAAPLTAGAGQCPDGYGYSAGGNCCWPMPAPDAGCVLFQVDIGTCE